jgi:hypothetical protein
MQDVLGDATAADLAAAWRLAFAVCGERTGADAAAEAAVASQVSWLGPPSPIELLSATYREAEPLGSVASAANSADPLLDAWWSLPMDQRAALWLRLADKRSSTVAAAILSLAPGAVTSLADAAQDQLVPDAASAACASRAELTAYVNGVLGNGKTTDIRNHLNRCGSCRERLARVERLQSLGDPESGPVPVATDAGRLALDNYLLAGADAWDEDSFKGLPANHADTALSKYENRPMPASPPSPAAPPSWDLDPPSLETTSEHEAPNGSVANAALAAFRAALDTDDPVLSPGTARSGTARSATPRSTLTPRSATPRSATPQSTITARSTITPRSATPRSASSRSGTARSATSRSATRVKSGPAEPLTAELESAAPPEPFSPELEPAERPEPLSPEPHATDTHATDTHATDTHATDTHATDSFATETDPAPAEPMSGEEIDETTATGDPAPAPGRAPRLSRLNRLSNLRRRRVEMASAIVEEAVQGADADSWSDAGTTSDEIDAFVPPAVPVPASPDDGWELDDDAWAGLRLEDPPPAPPTTSGPAGEPVVSAPADEQDMTPPSGFFRKALDFEDDELALSSEPVGSLVGSGDEEEEGDGDEGAVRQRRSDRLELLLRRPGEVLTPKVLAVATAGVLAAGIVGAILVHPTGFPRMETVNVRGSSGQSLFPGSTVPPDSISPPSSAPLIIIPPGSTVSALPPGVPAPVGPPDSSGSSSSTAPSSPSSAASGGSPSPSGSPPPLTGGSGGSPGTTPPTIAPPPGSTTTTVPTPSTTTPSTTQPPRSTTTTCLLFICN